MQSKTLQVWWIHSARKFRSPEDVLGVVREELIPVVLSFVEIGSTEMSMVKNQQISYFTVLRTAKYVEWHVGKEETSLICKAKSS